MATSTLLQKLDPVADGFGASTSHRRQVESFLTTLTNGGGAPATISLTAGTWVAFNSAATGSDKVLKVLTAANVAAGNTLVVGVVLETVSALLDAGASLEVTVKVVTSGFVSVAAVTTGVAAGSRLVIDTTAGRADAAAAGEIPCGVALTLAAANVAEVLVIPQF